MIETGQILNDTYEITESLGSGAGGIIFKAYHRRMRKYVAVKLIKEEIKGALDNRSEVDLLKNLKHRYLPQVIDFVEDGDDVYTVMEFIEGQNFKQIITNGQRFDEKSVRKYAIQLCEAAEYLHSHQPPIIHSDIKPANIMLTPQDNICLIDFNISMMTNSGTAAAAGGSRGFAAPEQFKKVINAPVTADEFHEETRFMDSDGTEILPDIDQSVSDSVSGMKTKNIARAFIDIRTDIYGIGASVYYMLTARIPAAGQLDFRGISCSTQIKKVIAKAMSPDPSKRYKSASEMKRALQSGISVKTLAVPAAAICAAALFVGIVSSGVPGKIANTGSTKGITDTIAKTTADGAVQTAVAAEPQSEGFITIRGEQYSTKLTELDLDMPGLTDEDIKPLSQMVNLTKLSIRYDENNNDNDSQFSDLSPLSGLTNLTYLDLTGNQIGDISALSGLTNLTKLDLSGNHIIDVSALSGLTKLTELILSGNQIYDISTLSGLTNLTKLDLSSNHIIDVSALSGLTKLKELRLDMNWRSVDLYMDITPLSGLTDLTYLDLYANNLSGMDALSKLTGLTYLNLSSTSVIDISMLEGLTGLTYLNMEHCNVQDISALSGLTKLKELNLDYNMVSNISALRGLTELTSLSINYNLVSSLEPLSGLASLSELYMYSNAVSNLDPLSGLTGLKALYLDDNQIADLSPLIGLTGLEVLSLGQNQIADIEPLSGLTGLKELILYENQISDISPLSGLTNLKKLELRWNTDISDSDIEALRQALPDCSGF